MAGPLKVAVQMDPIETINIDGDSSFQLMLTAQERGHRLWHYEVRHMSLREGVLKPDKKEFRACQWIRPEDFHLAWAGEMKRDVYVEVFRDFFYVALD